MPGTTINITSASSGTLGSFVMTSNGAYTFTPRHANYSGAVPVITYTASNATFSDSHPDHQRQAGFRCAGSDG